MSDSPSIGYAGFGSHGPEVVITTEDLGRMVDTSERSSGGRRRSPMGSCVGPSVLRLPVSAPALLVALTIGACGGAEDRPDAAVEVEDALTGPAVARMTNRELARRLAADDPGMRPLDTLALPDAATSAATVEEEPNNSLDEATPLGSGRFAQGALENRDRDHFTFEVPHPPQRWLLVAEGESVARMTHRSPAGEEKRGRRDPEDPARHYISNLFLLPGTHSVRVAADRNGGAYTLRIVPLGPPDALAEREPNDDDSRAHRLLMGAARQGHLFEPGDRDHYYFTLEAESEVLVQVVPPPGVETRMELLLRITGNRAQSLVRMDGDATDGALVYRGRLQPGPYDLRVESRSGGSGIPYALRIDRLDPFASPIDREPNDGRDEAAPVPPDLVVHGYAGEHRDEDWYRLPSPPVETGLTAIPSPDVLRRNRPQSVLTLYGEEDPLRSFGWQEDDSVFAGTVPGGAPLYARIRGEGPYRFEFVFDRPVPDTSPSLPLVVGLPAARDTLAAYWHAGQRVDLPVTLSYGGDDPRPVSLRAVSSHPAWRPRLADSTVTLEPGEPTTVDVAVAVRPDAWADRPVQITVEASDERGAWRTGRTTLVAACGVPPVRPVQDWPVPDALLGGLNLAATALGSVSAPDDEALFDGFTANDGGWRARLPATVTVELAGGRPVRVAGVLLHPQNGHPLDRRARDFDVEVSLDGETFTPVRSGVLDRYPLEQAFLFELPVEARFVRLRVRSSYAGTEGDVNLGELKVVAPPDGPAPESPINLASPALGGHVVWSDPLLPRNPVILTEEEDATRIRLDPLDANAWVVGFHHGRAARVQELQWVRRLARRAPASFMRTVRVAVSTETPLGPWTPVGTWTLDPGAEGTLRWRLDEPVWARYVRFSTTEPSERGQWYLPETIRILERATDATYRSILGEWGQYGRPAVYEWLHPPEPEWLENEADANDTRETAQALFPGATARGSVRVGEDEDWYRIEVPGEDNRLSLSVAGDPEVRARLTLVDEDARTVPLERVEAGDGRAPTWEARVTPGAAYWVHLEEPPRSIAFVWDNSASVGPFKPTIYRTMARFAEGIRPGREHANLWPFSGDGGFLLEEWADRPELLVQAVGGYDRRHSSSSAEDNLYGAVTKMGRRTGEKAIILLTDAESPTYRSTPLLWRSLEEVRPRIFALELHRGDVARHQDLMQSWAYAAHGRYDHFASRADLEVGLERATCVLRRPARYGLTATTRYETPPEPGRLALTAPGTIAGRGAIELILDASGSMLQRLGGTRRITIARDVLTDLVTETLPAGTPVALRVFGHRTPDACQTDLEVPLAPLDPDRVGRLIAGIDAKNLARTPIARSLSLVAEDLSGVEGQRLVLLITDGEETCEGDPAAVIRQLKEDGIDIRLNIVGFAIDDASLKSGFESWASLGGGRYFDARSGEELAAAVGAALRPKFQVFDAGGSVVAEGTVGADPVSLPVGRYSVKVLTSPPRLFEEVRIEPGAVTRLEVPPSG